MNAKQRRKQRRNARMLNDAAIRLRAEFDKAYPMLKNAYLSAGSLKHVMQKGCLPLHDIPKVFPVNKRTESTPNLQDIPIHTEDGRRIREAFIRSINREKKENE